MSVVKACTFDIRPRRLAFGLFAGLSSGEWAWSRTMGQFPHRSFTSILELESFVQVKELSSKCKMACLGEIDRAEPLGERQESFKEGKGDVDVESDEESWHSFDEDCDADGSKLPVC